MSQHVPKWPLQTHSCPNELVIFISQLPSFYKLHPLFNLLRKQSFVTSWMQDFRDEQYFYWLVVFLQISTRNELIWSLKSFIISRIGEGECIILRSSTPRNPLSLFCSVNHSAMVKMTLNFDEWIRHFFSLIFRFSHKTDHFLLYTERFHFYRRIFVRGIKNLVFYQLPNNPHLYRLVGFPNRGGSGKQF